MAHKVLYPFRDKTNNKKLIKKGETYDHTDEQRIKMLQEKGFLEKKNNAKGGNK